MIRRPLHPLREIAAAAATATTVVLIVPLRRLSLRRQLLLRLLLRLLLLLLLLLLGCHAWARPRRREGALRVVDPVGPRPRGAPRP